MTSSDSASFSLKNLYINCNVMATLRLLQFFSSALKLPETLGFLNELVNWKKMRSCLENHCTMAIKSRHMPLDSTKFFPGENVNWFL